MDIERKGVWHQDVDRLRKEFAELLASRRWRRILAVVETAVIAGLVLAATAGTVVWLIWKG